jgi:hypothetical protein
MGIQRVVSARTRNKSTAYIVHRIAPWHGPGERRRRDRCSRTGWQGIRVRYWCESHILPAGCGPWSLRLAGFATAKQTTFGGHPWPSRTVNGAIHSAAKQRTVSRVDNRVDRLPDYVPEEPEWHNS